MSQKYQSNPADNNILREIGVALSNQITEWYGKSAFLQNKKPRIVANRNSFLLIYEIGAYEGGQKRIFLKIRRQTHMKTLAAAIATYKQHNNTEKEYETLRELYLDWEKYTPRWRALRPLGYLELWHALAMEEFPSTNLDELAHKEALLRRYAGEQFLNAAKETGQWLAFYHARENHIREQPLGKINLQEEIEKNLELLAKYISDKELLDELAKRFYEKTKILVQPSLTYSMIHGDFKAENILVSEQGEVCAIDMKPRFAPIYKDLAQMLVDLDTYKAQIFSFGMYFPKKFVKAYQNTVLDGYLSGKDIDRDLLAIYCGLRLLEKWVLNETIMQNYASAKRYLAVFLKPIARRHFKQRILEYLFSRY